MEKLYTIRLDGIYLRAYHGCYDLEQQVGNRFRVDLAIRTPLGNLPKSDDVREAADVVAQFTTDRRVVLNSAGEMVPVVQMAIPDAARRMYNRLRSGADHFYCGERLREMDSLHRVDLFTGLVFDRIARKYGDIDRIFEQSKDRPVYIAKEIIE